MSSPAVAHHLKLLKSTGLITARREGKEVYYKGGRDAVSMEASYHYRRGCRNKMPAIRKIKKSRNCGTFELQILLDNNLIPYIRRNDRYICLTGVKYQRCTCNCIGVHCTSAVGSLGPGDGDTTTVSHIVTA